MLRKVLVATPLHAFTEAAAMLETAGLEIVRSIKPNAEKCNLSEFGATMSGVHAAIAGIGTLGRGDVSLFLRTRNHRPLWRVLR